MKGASNIIVIGLIIMMFCTTCETTTILDYENKLFEQFFEKRDFTNNKYDGYRKGDSIFFASIKRSGDEVEEFTLWWMVYSSIQQNINIIIDKVELLTENNDLLFSNKEINFNGELRLDGNLFIKSIVLITDIPKLQLQIPKENYIVKVYFNNDVFIYEFYPHERRYVIAISQ